MKDLREEIKAKRREVEKLRAQVARLTEAERALEHLEFTLQHLEGQNGEPGKNERKITRPIKDGSSLAITKEILREHGPLHISEIIKKCRERGRDDVNKDSLVSSISKHIRKSTHPDFVRVQGKANTFALANGAATPASSP